MQGHLPTTRIRAKRLLLTLFPGAAILSLGILGLFGFFIYKVSYPDKATEAVNPSHYLLPFVTIGIPSGTGPDISAWWIPGLKGGPGIILAPGYGMGRSDALSLAFALNQRGFNVLIYAQRGSGANPRGASTLGLLEVNDMASVIQYLKQREDNDSERIGIWGVDVGAYAALKAAADFPEVRTIVADSPYATVQEYLDYRMAEDFNITNDLLLFGCHRVFRLAHLNQALPAEELRTDKLSDKTILFIKGEESPQQANLAAAVYQKMQPKKEILSLKTARTRAMSGDSLKAYDTQAADFFHINLK